MYIIVLITCPDEDCSQRITEMLLNERLAACVISLRDIKSRFWWAGKMHDADELLLMVKTKKSLLKEIIKKIKAAHDYSNPEIIALPVIGGSKEYMKWIEDETK